MHLLQCRIPRTSPLFRPPKAYPMSDHIQRFVCGNGLWNMESCGAKITIENAFEEEQRKWKLLMAASQRIAVGRWEPHHLVFHPCV